MAWEEASHGPMYTGRTELTCFCSLGCWTLKRRHESVVSGRSESCLDFGFRSKGRLSSTVGIQAAGLVSAGFPEKLCGCVAGRDGKPVTAVTSQEGEGDRRLSVVHNEAQARFFKLFARVNCS